MMNLTTVTKGVYRLHFEDQYDMSMMCVGFTEWYEGYTLPDFMKRQALLRNTDAFAYVKENAGFVLWKSWVYEVYNDMESPTYYDSFVYNLFKYLTPKTPDKEDFAIIFTCDLNDSFEHEFAHVLYESNEDYKSEITDLLNLEVKKSDYTAITSYLANAKNTDPEYLDDELQAYLCTGVDDRFPQAAKKYTKKFRNVFLKYRNKILS